MQNTTNWKHAVLNTPLNEVPEGFEVIVFAMGCFWGAERMFWGSSGVYSTSVGYSGGHVKNPDYESVCTGRTGHCEVVKVTFDPSKTTLEDLLRVFWESHDPTQGNRQGNDIGSQYRSAIYYKTDGQFSIITKTKDAYRDALKQKGHGEITTEIKPLDVYYFAESYHQQYLAKNPNGYCGLGGTGVSCPRGIYN